MGRIVVVDDDEVSAVGAKVVLNRMGFDAVDIAWRELADRLASMGHIEVLIAVVRRDLSSWDRYRNLHAAGDLRSHLPANTRIVAAASAAEATNPLLGLRLHRAGVDDLLTMRHIQSVERLADVAGGQMTGRDPRPAPEAWSPGSFVRLPQFTG